MDDEDNDFFRLNNQSTSSNNSINSPYSVENESTQIRDSETNQNQTQGSNLIDSEQLDNDNLVSNQAKDLPSLIANTKRGDNVILRKEEAKILQRSRADLKIDRIGPANKGKRKGYSQYQLNAITVPRYFYQIKNLEDRSNWYTAMEEENGRMRSLDVYEEVDRPIDTEILPLMWVYRIKFDSNGELDKYKARLVVVGSKKSKSDYESTYTPVLNDFSMRILLTFACKSKYSIGQLDVCTAYLNAPLDNPVFVKQPIGFKNGKKVWKLKKSAYGLRVSAINWYNTFSNILINIGLRRSLVDTCVFILELKDFQKSSTKNLVHPI